VTDALLDIIQSLTRLMREETALLLGAGPRRDLEALAGAKLRLTASLESQLATLDREQPDWRADGDADAFAGAIREMQDVSSENARVLKRQIELSREMLDAIAAEAKRLAGSRTQTYGATGGVFRIDGSTPISVNTSL
jgi:flagellar biosynthesis/type III secretory pathway chaperone